MSAEIQPVRIFIAYSSKDLTYKDEIRKRLKPLVRAGKVTIWDNYDIEGGADWDADIREKLEVSDLILLLLSPDALDSDYFYDTEAPIALRRHKAGEALAVGVLLRPCALKHTPFEFEQYELLPKKGYPVTHPHWPNTDAAYLTIFEEIDHLVEKFESIRAEQMLRLERQREYAKLIGQADVLMKKNKWVEAKALLDKALKTWEEDFEPKRELLEKQLDKCREEMKAIEAVERKKQQEAVEAADNVAWQSAEKTNTEAAYKKYLQQYPGGLHAAQAKKKIAAYEQAREEESRKKREREAAEARAREDAEKRRHEEIERKRREAAQAAREQQLREQADHDLWEFAEEADTEAAYKKYLSKYSNGIHVNQAKKKIAAYHEEREAAEKKKREEEERRKYEEAEKRRKQEEAEGLKREEEQADKSAWELAQKTDTAEGYARYLRMYSSGRYAVQAYRLQQELIENEAEATAKKQREEEARKKREREAAEARAREEAEKRRREETLAAERRRQEEDERKKREEEAEQQQKIDLEKERRKIQTKVKALLSKGIEKMEKDTDHSKVEAIELFSQVIQLDPNHDEAYCLRGTVMYQLERYEEALKDYNRAIQINPYTDDSNYYLRGQIYMKLERYKEAVKDFERLKPDSAPLVLKYRKALRVALSLLEASENPQPPKEKKKNWLGL